MKQNNRRFCAYHRQQDGNLRMHIVQQPQQQQAAAAPEESTAVDTMPVVSATVTPIEPGEVASIRAASLMLDQRVDDIAAAPRPASAAQ